MFARMLVPSLACEGHSSRDNHNNIVTAGPVMNQDLRLDLGC
jgi:hypothetical protein